MSHKLATGDVETQALKFGDAVALRHQSGATFYGYYLGWLAGDYGAALAIFDLAGVGGGIVTFDLVMLIIPLRDISAAPVTVANELTLPDREYGEMRRLWFAERHAMRKHIEGHIRRGLA